MLSLGCSARLAIVFLTALTEFSCAQPVQAQQVPPRALQYLPILVAQQHAIWPNAPHPSFLAAQVEQESCISLTHSKCWNPSVQLKTSREWGRGLGQVTTAYRADGTVRFDRQAELRDQFTSLRGWTTDRWADPTYQLTAIVEMDFSIFRRTRDAADDRERLAFMLAAYNGGEAGVLQDRRLCANTPGCNPRFWFAHVERASLKSKAPMKGYGRSPFSINREYPAAILGFRKPKYDKFWDAK